MSQIDETLLFLSRGVLIAISALAESPTIFLVRHAERADTNGPAQPDPVLSDTGQTRAATLAKILRDAGITAIYTSEYQRTRQTAAPLAGSLGIKAKVIPAKDTASLIAKLRTSVGNVLVIGHSNTLPEIIGALGIPSPVTIAEKDYDDLFIVVLDQRSRLIHLHYR